MTERKMRSSLYTTVMGVSSAVKNLTVFAEHRINDAGASIAKYSGQHVHARLLQDEAYAAKDYRTALKRAFLGTDDDLRTGMLCVCTL